MLSHDSDRCSLIAQAARIHLHSSDLRWLASFLGAHLMQAVALWTVRPSTCRMRAAPVHGGPEFAFRVRARRWPMWLAVTGAAVYGLSKVYPYQSNEQIHTMLEKTKRSDFSDQKARRLRACGRFLTACSLCAGVAEAEFGCAAARRGLDQGLPASNSTPRVDCASCVQDGKADAKPSAPAAAGAKPAAPAAGKS